MRQGMDSQVHHPRSLPQLVSAWCRRAGLATTAVLLMAASLPGCTQQPPNVMGSVEALRDIHSFDFVEKGSHSTVPYRYFLGTTGTFQSPNRFSKRVSYRAYAPAYAPEWPPEWPEEISVIRSISIGNKRYLTDPVSEDWIPYHKGLEERGFMLIPLFTNPVDTLQETLSQAGRFEFMGVDTLDGVSVRYLTWGTEFVKYPGRAVTRRVDIFIGVEDSLVRKLVVDERWRKAPRSELDILIPPGSARYGIEFSFPGDETPIVGPPVDRDIVSTAAGPMALFKNSHVPFSIRYPAAWKPYVPLSYDFFTWQEAVFRDDESPGQLQIRTRFVDDIWFRKEHRACFNDDRDESGDSLCAVAQRIDSRLAVETFEAGDYNDLLLAEYWYRERPRPSRQRLGGGSGWSEEILEWAHERKLTHVHETATPRPECAPQALRCYAVIEVAYVTSAEDLQTTWAMADYSFSTLEWNGLTLGEGGSSP